MIDSKLIVTDLKECIRKLGRKNIDEKNIQKIHKLILEKNKLTSGVEVLRSQRNSFSKEVGILIAQKQKKQSEVIKQKVNKIKQELQIKEKQLEALENEIKDHLMNLPNFPDDESPDGNDSSKNKELLIKNYQPEIYKGKNILPHWEIMEKLNILDQARASKMSGSMFAILRGSGARLLRSLVAFAYEIYQDDYLEFIVPSMVNSETFTGTGHLPKFAEEAYHMEKDDLWAIPTGEVPLTALHRDEILPEVNLPLKYMTYTSCFRREAGAAGQDTRGLQRLHEFHKVELVKICKPENSSKELESLLQDALKPIQILKLPYRVLDLCSGDLTFASSRTFDIEVYSPGTKQWLEVSSVGLFTDYQSRRSNIRYRENKQLKFPHTLNGSGLATPRVLSAILENYLQEDGRVKVPDCLKKFMNCDHLFAS